MAQSGHFLTPRKARPGSSESDTDALHTCSLVTSTCSAGLTAWRAPGGPAIAEITAPGKTGDRSRQCDQGNTVDEDSARADSQGRCTRLPGRSTTPSLTRKCGESARLRDEPRGLATTRSRCVCGWQRASGEKACPSHQPPTPTHAHPKMRPCEPPYSVG